MHTGEESQSYYEELRDVLLLLHKKQQQLVPLLKKELSPQTLAVNLGPQKGVWAHQSSSL